MNARLMMTAALAAGLLAAGGSASTLRASTQTWNVADDFSDASNPNGAWAFGYGVNSLEFIAYSEIARPWNNCPNWRRPGLGLPAVWKNTSAVQGYGVNPGEVALHPDSGLDSAVQWTSPITGTVSVDAIFGKGDNGVIRGTICQNLAELLATGPLSGDYHYASEINVAAGDTLRFYVNNYDGIGYDNTPLSLTIAAIPEPATGLGDFSGDRVVDQGDYTTWADNFGLSAAAFANGSRSPITTGPVNQGDYTTWADNFSNTYPATVPEPATLSLLAVAGLFLKRRR